MEDNLKLKKNGRRPKKMEDDLTNFFLTKLEWWPQKSMEDDLKKKSKNGRRTQK